jgi:hypothetical protein
LSRDFGFTFARIRLFAGSGLFVGDSGLDHSDCTLIK